jgi:hypothetical protein
MSKHKHVRLSLLHSWRFVIRNDQGVVCIFPSDGRVVNLQLQTLQVRNINALVILLVCGLQNNLLLLRIHLDNVSIFGVGEVTNSPLKPVLCVFPLKLWVGI